MKFILFALVLLPLGAMAQTYNCNFTTQQDYTATGSSVNILSKNKNRRCLVIRNNGSTTVLVKFDSAHSALENFKITSGSTWEPVVIPVNSIYIKSINSGLPTNITVLEGQ